jgi:hypothetical protein
MLAASEFKQYLTRLGLSTSEAAQLLGVKPRTVRRWLEGEELPGPAEQALRAWIRLHDRHLPWRPDSVAIIEDDQDEITRNRWDSIELDALLSRAEARGGPRLPWTVNWDRGLAVLGPMEVSFYKRPNGGFALSSYRRTDGPADAAHDGQIIEDAVYSIARALQKKNPDFGPVTLFVQDGTAKGGRTASLRSERFMTAREAVHRVCETMGKPGFYDPFITTETPGDLLWDKHELKRECERRAKAPAALTVLADYVRTNSKLFVQSGPQMLSLEEVARRRHRIQALADELDKLAAGARDGKVKYPEFDTVLGALHALGFFPDTDLVSAVAQALIPE